MFTMVKPALHRLRWPLLVIGVTIALIILMKVTAEAPSHASARKSFQRVETQLVVQQPDSIQVELYGQVETPHLLTLTAPLTGYVQSSSIVPGARVQKGDVLLRLDPKDQQLVIAQRQADVLEAQAVLASEQVTAASNNKMLVQETLLLDSAEREYQRLLSLQKNSLVSDSVLDGAREDFARQQLVVLQRQQQIDNHSHQMQLLQARLARVEALLASAKLDLARSELKAPFDGRVVQMLATNQERVMMGEVLVELYGESSLEIRAQIPDRYLPNIVALQAQNIPITAVLGNDPVADRATWQLHRLSAHVQENRGGVDGFFRPKHAASVFAVLGRPVNLVMDIPLSSAVVRIEPRSLYDNQFVYRVLDSDELEAIVVNVLGTKEDQGREFFIIESEELKDGDRLLTTRVANAVTGLPVLVDNSDGQEEEGEQP